MLKQLVHPQLLLVGSLLLVRRVGLVLLLLQLQPKAVQSWIG
jgi:hypothetical protein